MLVVETVKVEGEREAEVDWEGIAWVTRGALKVDKLEGHKVGGTCVTESSSSSSESKAVISAAALF